MTAVRGAPPVRWPARAAAAALCALLAAGCGGGAGAGPAGGDRPEGLAATQPYLVMVSSSAGWAVWPSGRSWVVLRTEDGWAHVANATPPAVPTGGGLVLAAGPAGAVDVAVGPYDRLLSSPLLSRDRPPADWRAAELPGAVTDSRSAVADAGARRTAVVRAAGGTLVEAAGSGWTPLTDAARLAPGGGLTLDGVTWAGLDQGWLTGHAAAGTPVAYRTADGGRSWRPVTIAAGQPVAALAPCGADASWLLPLRTADGRVTVARTADGGATWRSGGALALSPGSPAWGCRGAEVWFAAPAAGGQHLFASVDFGQSWTDRGAAPAGLTDLTPAGGGTGFAASLDKGTATLWTVTGGGARFTSVRLPSWVATIGATMSTS